MSTVPNFADEEWRLPSRGKVAMLSLIVGECGIFTIFVAAYVYYIGRSLSGPTPRILDIPVFATLCLLSSSGTIWFAERAIERGKMRVFAAWWALTIVLGLVFIGYTAVEWHDLIYRQGLTIGTNLFGTTFYSLVGLHASHVIVGLTGLSIIMAFTLLGRVERRHAHRVQVFSMYWHFVDAVWVVVFTLVYLVGR